MTVDRKLMRNGNGWALSINSTILGLIDVNPEIDMVKYIQHMIYGLMIASHILLKM